MINLKNHCGQNSGMKQGRTAQLHLERLASVAAAPPVATTDEAGTVLGISRAQARRLATAAAAGCLIVRDTSQALSAVESPFWRAMRTTQRLPSDAALEAMTGTQLRKLMARRGVGRGPQDRKEDFIDKLKAHAAGETYVNKPNPYKRAPVRKRARAPPRRKAPVNTGGLRLGSRVWAFGKRGTITELPGDNGWWRVQLDGENGTRGARIGSMRALGGAAVPPPPPSSSPAPPKVEEKTTVTWGKIEDVPWG